MKTISDGEEKTGAVARAIAGELKVGSLVYLHGDLGVGKSVFARALIRELTGDAQMDVPSPTFTLVQEYDGVGAWHGVPIFHFDLYRIEDENEVLELGWEDALLDGISIVEWPERLGAYKCSSQSSLASSLALDIRIANVDNEPHMREILIERDDA